MAFKDALIAASPALLGLGQQLSGRNPTGLMTGVTMMNAEAEKAKRKANIEGLLQSMQLSQQKRDFLSMLPFEQQAPLIWETMNPAGPRTGVVGDKLVNLDTGAVIGDYGTPPVNLPPIDGFDFSPYAVGGATRPDSFTRMTPEMQTGLAAMMQAAEAELGSGLQVYSGYRSPELQAQLYEDALAKYGSEAEARRWVAPPGKSFHNKGMAADLKWNGVRLDQAPPEVRNWVKQNAARFGLAVPLDNEPWQVEVAGARGPTVQNAARGTLNPPDMPAPPKGQPSEMAMRSELAKLDAVLSAYGDRASPESRMPYEARRNLLKAQLEMMERNKSPIAALEARAIAAGLTPGTAEYRNFMLTNGRNDGLMIESDGQGGFRMVQGAAAGTQKPFTEMQSKDNVFVTRATGALEVLEPISDALTSRAGRAAEMDPTGLARELQTPEFQVAKQAGDEFLQAILRKDTGAAITEPEQYLYGRTYLPQPGDGPEVLQAKSEARKRAVAAIQSGMSPAQMIAVEKALGEVSVPEKEQKKDEKKASVDYSGMTMDGLLQNVPTTEEDAAEWNKRWEALQE